MERYTLPFRDGSPVKAYFVLPDDDDRERVISVLLDGVTIENNPDFIDVFTDDYISAAHRFRANDNYTITVGNLVPFPDGSVVRYENFVEDDDE